ncbi:MAG: glycine cleavage system protein R [Brevinematia bacterium]
MKKLVLTCMGKDKPGIVSKVSEVLFKMGCSIEGSRMSLLQGEFSIILIFSLPKDENYHQLRRELKRVEYEMDIDINIREVDPYEYQETQKTPKKALLVNIYGADKPGIVFKVTTVLYNNSINIVDLFTDVIESGEEKVYVMSITADTSSIESIEPVREEIKEICEDMKLEVSVQELEEAEM